MKNDIKDFEIKSIKDKKNFSKGIASILIISFTSSAFAAATFGDPTTDSFGQLLDKFVTWMQGNLGKLLALTGFMGTFVAFMMTNKGSVLFVGIIMSMIAGGAVGIVSTFFNAGTTALVAIP
jgi:hypothetical protein